MSFGRSCSTCGRGVTRNRVQRAPWLVVLDHGGNWYRYCPGDCADAALDSLDASDKPFLLTADPSIRLVELSHDDDAAGRMRLRRVKI